MTNRLRSKVIGFKMMFFSLLGLILRLTVDKTKWGLLFLPIGENENENVVQITFRNINTLIYYSYLYSYSYKKDSFYLIVIGINGF